MAVEMAAEGPMRGLFLYRVPPNTSVCVFRDGDYLLKQPFGMESKEQAASEKSTHLFLKPKGVL